MILIDYNQIVISNFLGQVGNHTNIELNTSMIRHTTLNTIRAIKVAHGAKYGDVVIACDHRHYWRKDVFPHYKSHRAAARENLDVDWAALFEALNTVREELMQHFPYRVIYAQDAEADDVIGVLTMRYGTPLASDSNRILIVSADKDFRQLQRFGNVTQWSPITKKFIVENNPEMYLKELIIRGDSGDAIPNILSPADSIVTKTRQKKMTEGRFVSLMEHPDLANHEDPLIRARFVQNRELIDFECIPTKVEQTILQEWDAQEGKTRHQLFNYFVTHKLARLMDSIGDF
jgi:5'-3' exonuclease